MTFYKKSASIYGIQTKGGVLMEEKRGLTIKDLLIRLILIIIFIFLLIWLFPMPDLKPLNNQIFVDGERKKLYTIISI